LPANLLPSGSSRHAALFPAVVPDGEGDVFIVRYSTGPLWGEYREAQPSVFVSANVSTNLDFPLPAGYYTVRSLSHRIYDDVFGESLDLALLMASMDKFGVYSANVNPDYSLSPILGVKEKSRALQRLGLPASFTR